MLRPTGPGRAGGMKGGAGSRELAWLSASATEMMACARRRGDRRKSAVLVS